MKELNSIHRVLKLQAENNPDAVALLAPDRKPLSYNSLNLHIEYIVDNLSTLGIVHSDRVAIVLPNGPEMTTAFLGVASGATSAPLNPAYREEDFNFYLSDLNAKALLIHRDFDSPARKVAQALGIPLIEITSNPGDAAGIFNLVGTESRTEKPANFAIPDDVALVLHTSGTTSRPKIVPLTHNNICTSAHNIKKTLQLTAQDRCLNVMPLFHIHGLMAVVLSSLVSGASIVCTPGFQADDFFRWLSFFQPTWFTAVPTMHQAILERVGENQVAVANSTLRFIRSSSASLPPQVMKKLEEEFHTPVIESYGMTEASHQMASNPLPPIQRKPGTVGIAAGPDVQIMDEQGNFLLSGHSGEIVIRGENVTSGYENNPSANQNAFINGWFRTGDLGVMDADGYLTITGRLKEIVNRGGEKIAPREVDETLLDHPNIAQAVSFGIPHPTLGEDLVAAVVLRANSYSTEQELREFTFSRLVGFKVPSQIIIVNEIPKGPTGKLQRIGLADKLFSYLRSDYFPPRNTLEETLTKIWKEVLKIESVGIYDNFFSLGGDSLSAASVIMSVEEATKKQLNPVILFHAPTIDQLARLLQSNLDNNHSSLVPLQPFGFRKPIFFVPGHGGDVFTFVELTKHLQPEQPVYAFRFPEPAEHDDAIANAMLKEMASSFIADMHSIQPNGPFQIGGFCFGGEVAFEMAHQLLSRGEKASIVVIIYAYIGNSIRFSGLRQRINLHIHDFLKSSPREKITYLPKRIIKILNKVSQKFSHNTKEQEPRNNDNVPMYYPGKITLFRPIEEIAWMYHDPKMGWGELAADIENFDIPGDKHAMLQEPHVQILAEQLKNCLLTSNQ